MRFPILVALLTALPWAAATAAPTWQTISAEPGKRIELDRTSLKRDGNTVQAQGRIVLDKELIDIRSGAGYRVIEAITRYDCGTRNANTVKRIYKKNETDVIREETLNGNDLPVRSGTLDDKVLREVCRPQKESATELAERANEAAGQLKLANEALLKKELAKTEKPQAAKGQEEVHEAVFDKTVFIPSIRPNLKLAAEKSKETAPPVPSTIKKISEQIKPSTVVVYNTPSTAPARQKPRRATKAEGYMLELARTESVMQHARIQWDYEGEGRPENWSKLDPKNTLCSTGQRQSPIDIRDGIKVNLEPIQFNYRPSTFRILNNGHTVQVEVGDSSIRLTGKSYELVSFHFHRPSEEKINGQRFDMVIHLEHKSDDGKTAIVAILLEQGSENPFIQTLWNNLPLEQHTPVEPPSAVIDLSNLLPATRSYYTYMGSETTPPCSEGVRWLVLKQPVQVSQEQINIFARLYKNNTRPIQPGFGRLIKEDR